MVEFTHEGYRRLIKVLKEHEYTVCNYDDYDDKKKVAILRHDIDTSVKKAVEFAKIESEEGVTGTYFVLLNTDFYNVNSAKTAMELKELQSLGAKIGLHFDETKYNAKTVDAMIECILKEKNMLELSLNVPITTVSMHRPSKWTLEQNIVIPGMVNSYSEEFFKNFKYVSDSRRNWREDVETIIKSEEFERLHILTHAFWYDEYEKSARDVLLEFIRSSKKERYLSLSENIRDIIEFVHENEV